MTRYEKLTEQEKQWVQKAEYTKQDINESSIENVIMFLKLQYAQNNKQLYEVENMVKRLLSK